MCLPAANRHPRSYAYAHTACFSAVGNDIRTDLYAHANGYTYTYALLYGSS